MDHHPATDCLSDPFPITRGRLLAASSAVVANPIVVGDTVYIQDGMSNVYVADKATGEQVWKNEYNDEVPTGGPNGTSSSTKAWSSQRSARGRCSRSMR
jgi:outer membrane protein assembly factor BamB